MRVVLGLVCFLVSVCALSACQLKPVIRSNEGTLEPKAESVEETIPSEAAVAFEGVSFRYDPRVFGTVTKELVPEHKLEEPDHKPDYVAPEHVLFEFEFGREYSKAQIAVYPLSEFPNAYSVSPDMVAYIKKDIERLRRVLKDPSYRLNGDIPHLPYADVSRFFSVRVRDLDFQNGDGIIFVTHWSHGADLVSNRNLLYRFEGITSDGRYYVTAETPVSVAFLPDDPTDEFEGYAYKNLFEGLNSKEAMARIKKYRESITTRLEKLNSNDFGPALEKFEAIISSLRVDSKNSPPE
jgi:hypothetical protein